MSVIDAPLESGFAHLAKALGADDATVVKWADGFTARYTEPQRHYHTLNHIHDILRCLVQFRSSVKDETTMKLAIFFHDWIYDPKRKDNEIESIKCFMDFAHQLSLPDSLSSRVSGYIERTITHTLPTDDNYVQQADSDLSLFLDFDLEVLSRSDADYARYAEQIQAEYGHMKPADYYAGRLKVLRSFLARDRLYFSDVFYESFEQKARRNLEQEIASLQCKLG
jgi:predicted metal-dependent HD superfamily phosphohydrolase